MINPSMRERAWICRNILLLGGFQLPTPQAGPGSARSPVLAAVESLAVAKTVAEMVRNSNTGLPLCCTAEMVEPAVDEAAGGGEADDGITPAAGRSRPPAVKVSFLWRDAYKSDPASKALVDRLRRRMIPAGRGATVPAPGAADGRGRGPRTSPGGGASAAGAGGARPPAAPVVPGVAKPARRKRGGRTTPRDRGATTKSVRSVRSDAVKAQLAAAEELVARAFQDEQHRTVVVQPPYTVREVEANQIWPHGGILLVAQFPFSIDDSWRARLKEWRGNCTKVIASTTGKACVGGTYVATLELFDPAVATPTATDGALRVDLVAARGSRRTGTEVAGGEGDGEEEEGSDDNGEEANQGGGGGDGGRGSSEDGSNQTFHRAVDGNERAGTAGTRGGGGGRRGGGGDDGNGGGSGGSGGSGATGRSGNTTGASQQDGVSLVAAPAFESVSLGLHDILLRALKTTNAGVGLPVGQVVRMRTITCSPPSPFSLTFQFRFPKDLDTTKASECEMQDRNHIAIGFPVCTPPAAGSSSRMMLD